MAMISKSAPWVIYYREVQALFAKDGNIRVFLNEEKHELDIYVDGQAKADALTKLFPTEKIFGNVTLKVKVIPSNDEGEGRGRVNTYRNSSVNHSDIFMTFCVAFSGNTALDFVEEATVPGGMKVCYVVFMKDVVQFFSDDLTDYFGMTSTLYQNIAKDVFKEDLGVFYSTTTANYEHEVF